MLHLVSPPEAEAERDKALTTRTLIRQGTARKDRMARSISRLMAVRRGLRAAIEEATGVVADLILRIGHAAGREPPLIEGGRGLETADAVVIGREVDKRALPQPLR